MRAGFLLAALVALTPAGAEAEAFADARALFDRMGAEDCSGALAEGVVFAQSPALAELQPRLQELYLGRVIDCSLQQRNMDTATVALDVALEKQFAWARGSRLSVALDLEDTPRALAAFDMIVREQPELLGGMTGQMMRLARAARESDPTVATELRIYEQFRATLGETEPSDYFRGDYASALLRLGRADEAMTQITAMDDPRALARVRLSRDFAPLWSNRDFDRATNLRRASERRAAELRREIDANPRRLQLVSELARALRGLGRQREALALVRPVLRRAQAGDGAQQFDDHAESTNWLLNEEAYILYELGRRDEGRVAFRFSVMAGEAGNERNVSQVINYASHLEEEARPQEALDTLREVGEASPYGDMWVANVRACAAEQQQDIPVRDEALRFLREHENDNPAALTGALICVNDLDSAAAAYVRRLADPRWRSEALGALQIYRPGAHAMPLDPERAARLDLIRARPDVRAAAEAVGRIEEVPLESTYWGDF